jgi:hypothetical protein
MLKFVTILMTPVWLLVGGWALVLAAAMYALGAFLEARSKV